MSNRLANETSPYLRQHADNPVHWWPWSPQALAAAREQDKPILLSIGYSACHWCHVMAHESFEDPATAQSMNDKFICIKVDREERPDIDKIYQLAQQALTQRGGGWPLTLFLAPDDLTPFYAGTYFPKAARYGSPPFAYVLDQVRGFWDRRRDAVREQNATLRDFLAHYGESESASGDLSEAPVHAALVQISRNFDLQFGGHLGAPKFPHAAEMELLFDSAGIGDAAAPAAQTNDKMIALTLTRMAEGGIHDQLGGGFCRYSVDERWEIPHFEKMLYDNAQLLPLYARAARGPDQLAPLSKESSCTASARLYRRAAFDLVAWLLREMIADSGAFYAALDADSEGEEGRFYVWQRDEVRELLSDREFTIVDLHYGFQRAPNFEHSAWNPIVAESLASIASRLGQPAEDVESDLQSARHKLFARRAQRVRPGLDDKILTSWNALMIGGLARASREMAAPDFLLPAERALDFLHDRLWRNNRLLACHAGGVAKFAGYLDDYAFLLDALLEMLATRWLDRDLTWAIALADSLLEHFEDRARGGFWFTAHDHETLIQRPKPWTDEAIPSGNGVAVRALLRLGHLIGQTRYLDAAERALRAAYPTLQQMPQACASLQRALLDHMKPRQQIVVRFDADEESLRWQQALSAQTLPRTDVYFIPASSVALPGTLGAQKYICGAVAYVCRGTACGPPLADPAALDLAQFR